MKTMLKIFVTAALLSAGSTIYAAQYDIKQMTPEVRQALENRRARFNELHALKAQGIVGENNRGYIEFLESGAAASSLVIAENSDRKVIYQTIAEQNDLQGQLDTIEKVFAQVQRDKAESGDRIQGDDGQWIQK